MTKHDKIGVVVITTAILALSASCAAGQTIADIAGDYYIPMATDSICKRASILVDGKLRIDGRLNTRYIFIDEDDTVLLYDQVKGELRTLSPLYSDRLFFVDDDWNNFTFYTKLSDCVK